MKKVLVIAYFYPPCNLTAAQRMGGWAEHFHEAGLYPVIITRNWDHMVKSPADILKPGGEELRHVKTETHEVYYLPHRGSLRDRLYSRLSGTRWAAVTKFLTLLELFGQNFFSWNTPFRYLFHFAKQKLKEDNSIDTVLISANPFILFKFGYKLKKQFPRIRWYADYRDDWTTSEINSRKGFVKKWIHKLEMNSEKKWLSNARAIISVSPYYTTKISDFVRRPGITIYNGFDRLEDKSNAVFKDFSIVYNGTLYPTQPIEDFLEVVKETIKKHPEINFRVRFPGLGFDPVQEERVRRNMTGFESFLEITARISKEEVLAIQRSSQLLVFFTHGVRGITSSKLFEYLALQKPVLVYPGDNDIVDSIIHSTRSGDICRNKSELLTCLEKRVEEFIKNGYTLQDTDENSLTFYSKKQQAVILAEYLKSF